ncbi:MAG: sensor histidine kinase [Mesorhizobium sp.]
MSGSALQRRFRRLGLGVGLVSLALTAGAVWLAQEVAGRRAEADLKARATEALALQSEALSGVLEKYRLLPPLLARRREVIDAFALQPSPLRNHDTQRMLVELIGFSGAREVALAEPDGTLVAAARGLVDPTIMGSPALQEATSQRRLGRAAITLLDGTRTYAFAANVRQGDTALGMIAVFVPFEPIEAQWSLSSNPIFVTGTDNIVFLSNRREWRQREWSSKDLIRADPLAPPFPERVGFVRGPAGALWIDASREMPLLGWTLHVLADARPLATARWTAGTIAGLAVLLLSGAAFVLLRRRQTALNRQRRDRAQAIRLERMVRTRTAELTLANRQLAEEIDERRQAEERLRATQAELVHAAKLATIGQMSAALSHEYNQPIAAIRTYADNAGQFLARSRLDAVGDALARIAGLADRMASLTRTLLTFSRKPGTRLSPVPLKLIADEAALLTEPRARKAGIVLDFDVEPDLILSTGRVRLSQVLVNLIGNAIDALEGPGGARPNATVRVEGRRSGERALLTVSDNGPGFAPGAIERLFEPFYTTKDAGEGLGLGLAIVEHLVRDLGGTIRATQNPDGGACFIIDLPLHQERIEAAE